MNQDQNQNPDHDPVLADAGARLRDGVEPLSPAEVEAAVLKRRSRRLGAVSLVSLVAVAVLAATVIAQQGDDNDGGAGRNGEGVAGRASGQASDLRMDFPWAPYDALRATMATHRNGDVAARVLVRFEEIFESLRLIREIVLRLPAGTPLVVLNPLPAHGIGAGWVEGWRGDVLVTLELEAGGIRRCHCHDPSWQNWPLLEHAVMDNIVPDFPVINKSFNLSYSGQDL